MQDNPPMSAARRTVSRRQILIGAAALGLSAGSSARPAGNAETKRSIGDL